MSQTLDQGTDFNITFFGIATDSLHLLFADGIGGAHFGTAGIAQLVFHFPNDGIYLIAGQFINGPIVVFRPVQMMLRIKVNGTVRDFGIIRHSETWNRDTKVTTILH